MEKSGRLFNELYILLCEMLENKGVAKGKISICAEEIIKLIFKQNNTDTVRRWIDGRSRPRIRWNVLIEENVNNFTFYDKVGAVIAGVGGEDRIEVYSFQDDEKTVFNENISQWIEEGTGSRISNRLTIVRKIHIYFIWRYCNNVLETVINRGKYMTRGVVDTKFESVQNFAWVKGAAFSGKTSSILHYAEKNKMKVVYCENPLNYEEVINKIDIEYLDILADRYKSLRHKVLEIAYKENAIKNVSELFVLIVDGERLCDNDIIKLIDLSRLNKIMIFVETRTERKNWFNQNIVEVPAFMEYEMIELFYLVREKKGWQKESVENKDKLDEILPNVCKCACYNPIFMILLAENYWNDVKRNHNNEEAMKFLQNVVTFVPVGKRESAIQTNKFYSSIDYLGMNQEQLRLLGHISNIFVERVPEENKQAFYLLALLDGIAIDMHHVKKWFNIEDDVLFELENEGWCRINKKNMYIAIPKLLVHAVKYDRYKDTTQLRSLKKYAVELTKTLERNEIQPVEIEVMQQIILRLHNIIFIQLKNKKSLLDKDMCRFHFTSEKYFLLYGDSITIKEIENCVKIEDFKSCQGASEYKQVLDCIKGYMNNNDISKIEEDFENLVQLHCNNATEFSDMALEEMFCLMVEKSIMIYENVIFDEKINSKNSEQTILRGRRSFGAIISEYNLSFPFMKVLRKPSAKLDFLQEFLRLFLLSEAEKGQEYILNDAKQMEIDYLKKYVELSEKTVAESELQIYMESFILFLYCKNIIGEQNKTQTEIKKRIAAKECHLRELVQEVKVLPYAYLEIFLLATLVAGVILQIKKPLCLDDFRFIKFYDEELTEQFQNAILKYNEWMKM